MNQLLPIVRKNFYRYYFLSALIIGIFYVFLLPPFHSPDEPNHFYRIYQITEGHFFPEMNPAKDSLGGGIAKSLITVSAPFLPAIFQKDVKIPADTIIRYLFYPLNKKDTTFYGFINTARYPPTAYLPQIATVAILKIFNTPPIVMLYTARIAALLFWLCALFITLKLTPVFKELIAVLALAPTCAAISSSVSADVVSNGLLFIQMGLFLKWKFSEEPVARREKIIFMLLALVTTVNKLCYFPLILLIALVNKEKMGGARRKYIFIGGLLTACLALIAVWGKLMRPFIYPFGDVHRTPYFNMRPGIDVNPDLQIQFILARPFSFLWRFWVDSLDSYTHGYGYIGNCGWDVGVPSGVAIAAILFLTALSVFQRKYFTFWESVWLALVAHSMNMLLLFLMHLNWDGVGETMINYYHGKYYIPIYPLFFFAIPGLANALGLKKSFAWAFDYRIILLYALAINIDMMILIVQRFYR